MSTYANKALWAVWLCGTFPAAHLAPLSCRTSHGAKMCVIDTIANTHTERDIIARPKISLGSQVII